VSVVLEQSLKLDGIAAATHRIYACRYKGSGGAINYNFDSDGDDGVGLQLLRAMQITIILTKHGLTMQDKHVVTPI